MPGGWFWLSSGLEARDFCFYKENKRPGRLVYCFLFTFKMKTQIPEACCVFFLAFIGKTVLQGRGSWQATSLWCRNIAAGKQQGFIYIVCFFCFFFVFVFFCYLTRVIHMFAKLR